MSFRRRTRGNAATVAERIAPLSARAPYSRELLERIGVVGLHCGSGVNLHAGWLNTDVLELTGSGGTRSSAGRIATCGSAFYLQHDASKAYPLEDGSMSRVLAEHFIEHLPFPLAAGWLGEMRRVLVRGGVLRISTPDLEKYVRGYLGKQARAEGAEKQGEDRDAFFGEHRQRLVAMGIKDVPTRRAWMVNQIFYGWGHRWIYDREEIVYAAGLAGFARDDVHFVSFRRGSDRAMAELDLPIRNDESLYVEIVKR